MKLKEQIQYFEAMSAEQALSLLKKYDKDFPDDPNEETLNKFRRKFAKKFHPDVSDDNNDTLKAINNAIDTLKKNSNSGSTKKERGVPVWVVDKRSSYNHINEENYHDLNYIFKKAWELGGSKPNPTLLDTTSFHNFDGRYGRGSFTVYTSQRRPVQREIAKAMVVWDNHNRSKAVVVIPYGAMTVEVFPVVDGEVSEDSFNMPFGDSFNRNPFNDNNFVKRLQTELEKREQKQ